MRIIAKLVAMSALLFAGTLAASSPAPVTMSIASLTACSDAGVAECQFKLAQLIESGSGVTQDSGAAKALYEKAYAGGVEAAGPSLLRLMRNQSASKAGPTPQIESQIALQTNSASAHLATSIAGMTYAATGLPLGFEHTSFDQTEAEFGRQFRASECVHFGEGHVRCFAIFKSPLGTVRIAAFFRSGRMFSMAQLIPKGCAAQSAEFSKRMTGASREDTAFMAAFFLPSGIFKFSNEAVISAWSGNDTLHGITTCEKNDSGMVLLSNDSLDGTKEVVRQRAARTK